MAIDFDWEQHCSNRQLLSMELLQGVYKNDVACAQHFQIKG